MKIIKQKISSIGSDTIFKKVFNLANFPFGNKRNILSYVQNKTLNIINHSFIFSP